MTGGTVSLNSTTTISGLNPIAFALAASDLFLMSRPAGGNAGDYKVTLVEFASWLTSQLDITQLQNYSSLNSAVSGKVNYSDIVDNLNSVNGNVPLSAKQGKALNQLITNVANSINNHYRGTFISLAALQSALPTGNNGDYALVDTGSDNLTMYVWDLENNWAASSANLSGLTTDTVTEGQTNLYFTNARAIAAIAGSFLRFDQQQTLTTQQINNVLGALGLSGLQTAQSLYTRQIAAIEFANGTVGVDQVGFAQFSKSYRLYHFTADIECRVRLYSNATDRDNDLSRPIGVDPGLNNGLLFEYIASDSSWFDRDLSPLIDGTDVKSQPDGLIAYAIEPLNPAGSNGGTVNLSYLITEV